MENTKWIAEKKINKPIKTEVKYTLDKIEYKNLELTKIIEFTNIEKMIYVKATSLHNGMLIIHYEVLKGELKKKNVMNILFKGYENNYFFKKVFDTYNTYKYQKITQDKFKPVFDFDIEKRKYIIEDKVKLFEVILTIIFGMPGLHRFYRKDYLVGFVYLMTYGLLGVGWLTDVYKISKKYYNYRKAIRSLKLK